MFNHINDYDSDYKILFISEFTDRNGTKTGFSIGNFVKCDIFNNEISEEELQNRLNAEEFEIISYFFKIPVKDTSCLISFAKSGSRINEAVITDFQERIEKRNKEINKYGTSQHKLIIYNTSLRKSILMCTISHKIKYSYYSGFYDEIVDATCSKFNFYDTRENLDIDVL